MKITLLSVILCLSSWSISQEVIPLVDFNGFFKSFKNGFFRQIEFQQIKGFKGGDNLVGYIDIRGNLMVYDGNEKKMLTNIEVGYQVSDNMLAWKVAQTLNMWDAGKLRTLSYNCGSYWLRDSIIVFEDIRYNTVSAYYNGEVHTLFSSVSDFDPPDEVGENVVAFRDNGDFYKFFWNGKIVELDVWHNPIKFSGGTDIVAFNDPITGTFAVFDKGELIDVEDFHVEDYKAGRGFILYENLNGDLFMYQDGDRKQLSNYGADFWEVRDDVAIWAENGFTYALSNGKKMELARYLPKDYALKNGVIAFRNIMGGVSALIDGKVHEITNQMDAEYEIYGNAVLVKLFNNSYIVFKDGKKYRV